MIRPAALLAAAALVASAATAREIDTAALVALPAADVVVLGEVHDNPLHHANQTLATRAIAPKALVFEMLTDAEARRVTPALLADEAALERALGWSGKGWPDFAWYYPIFTAAPAPAIYGGDLGRDTVRRAMTEGAAAVLGPSGALFGLETPLPRDVQAQREADQMAAHCDALPEELLPGMVEAQRLRDAALARAVIAAYLDTGGPVVVITGNGHARTDQAIPAMLAKAMPDLSVTSVAQFETSAPDNPAFDYWLVTPATPREDPCNAFRR